MVRDYAPVPMVSFPWQVSGLRDVRGGSNPWLRHRRNLWPGKIRHGVIGDSNPAALGFRQGQSSPEKYPCLTPLAV